MDIQVQDVGISGKHGPLLEPTSFRVRSHELVLIAAEPGRGHTALALAMSGRMRHDSGTVLLDGVSDLAGLRRQVAIVDAPEVSEPELILTMSTVIGEELSMAKQPASRGAVRDWLAARQAKQYAAWRTELVPAELRTRLLTDTAAQRPGVTTLILVLPDRHGAGPQTWWAVACQKAAEGFGVVVLCSESAASLLDVPAARIGQHDQPPSLSFAPSYFPSVESTKEMP